MKWEWLSHWPPTIIKYSYLNGLRVAQQRDGVFTWIHADHLSSATRITDVNGLEVRRLAYAAFGEEAENQGSGDEPKYTYTGKEHDSTGLYYYGARYYDPALSRFISADTVYDVGPQGLNRYSYALNNPIRYNDPTGYLSYADEQDPQVWEDPRPPEERPITIGNNMAEEGEYVDVGDGMKAKTSDVENAPRVYPEGWPELRAAPKKSFLRTNPVSRYAGEVIMFGTNLVSSGQWWTDCNLITDECYSEKEIFDVQITVLTDIGLAVGTAKAEKLLNPSKALKKTMKALPTPKTVKHHIFNKFRGASPKSQKYRNFFKKHNIDLDRWTVEIPENMHIRDIHKMGKNWTTRWKKWIDANPNATTKEVYQFAGKLMDEYGLSGLPLVHYK